LHPLAFGSGISLLGALGWEILGLRGIMKQDGPEIYERAMAELFRELKVPRVCQELLRGFLTLSGYKVRFEASQMELAGVMFDNSESRGNLIKKTRYRLAKLAEWQSANRVELIRKLELGHRGKDEKDVMVFAKTQYEFTLLASVVEAMVMGDRDRFAAAIQAAVEAGKRGMVVAVPPKVYISKQIKRDRSNFKTTLRRMFEQAVKMEIDPFEYCVDAISDAEHELNRLNNTWKEQQGRKRRLEKHRSRMSKDSGNLEQAK
jgi:hypothetical protein